MPLRFIVAMAPCRRKPTEKVLAAQNQSTTTQASTNASGSGVCPLPVLSPRVRPGDARLGQPAAQSSSSGANIPPTPLADAETIEAQSNPALAQRIQELQRQIAERRQPDHVVRLEHQLNSTALRSQTSSPASMPSQSTSLVLTPQSSQQSIAVQHPQALHLAPVYAQHQPVANHFQQPAPAAQTTQPVVLHTHGLSTPP